MKKVLSLFILAAFILLSISYVSACETKDCKIIKTTIQGRVFFAETNESAGKAIVTVTCYHNGTTYTQTTKSKANGANKGSYSVTFPQTQCIAGDTVVVTATKNGLSGSGDDIVENKVSEARCPDIDIGLVNVPLVPEFGAVIGALTVLSSVGIFFFVRRK